MRRKLQKGYQQICMRRLFQTDYVLEYRPIDESVWIGWTYDCKISLNEAWLCGSGEREKEVLGDNAIKEVKIRLLSL